MAVVNTQDPIEGILQPGLLNTPPKEVAVPEQAVELAQEQPGFVAPKVDAPTIKPREFEPSALAPSETVEGRLAGILESESPLMKRAAYLGKAEAAKRGLFDSSISEEAATAAMIDRAMPIAQQDAQTQARLAEMTTQADLNTQMMELEAGINERLYGVQQEYAVELEGMRNRFEIQQNLDTQMGTVYQDGLKSISNLLNDPNLSAEQRETGLQVLMANMQSGLNFLAGIEAAPETQAGTEIFESARQDRIEELEQEIEDDKNQREARERRSRIERLGSTESPYDPGGGRF